MQKVSNYKTAVAYAEAWFKAAKDNKTEDTVLGEIKALKEGIASVAGLWDTLSTPIENEQQKYDLVSSLADDISLSMISKSVLQIIAENNRLKLVPLILDQYIRLYYKDRGIIEVTIDSAIELTAKQDEELKKVLEKELNAPVIIDYRIRPEILGGLAIRYNSFLIDDTLKSKLTRIEQTLTQTRV